MLATYCCLSKGMENKRIANNETTPQIKNPTKMGSAVVLMNLPIIMAIGTAINVDKKPDNAAPIPATYPMGSIVRALIFPKINPRHRN